ncbi:hypothetical protein DIPPA_10473 [Diplonema papillatum]|nr:hypothetical protein DIPPA_10473 [Diplonema papillatum]|eukprot:gene23057-35329_t
MRTLSIVAVAMLLAASVRAQEQMFKIESCGPATCQGKASYAVDTCVSMSNLCSSPEDKPYYGIATSNDDGTFGVDTFADADCMNATGSITMTCGCNRVSSTYWAKLQCPPADEVTVATCGLAECTAKTSTAYALNDVCQPVYDVCNVTRVEPLSWATFKKVDGLDNAYEVSQYGAAGCDVGVGLTTTLITCGCASFGGGYWWSLVCDGDDAFDVETCGVAKCRVTAPYSVGVCEPLFDVCADSTTPIGYGNATKIGDQLYEVDRFTDSGCQNYDVATPSWNITCGCEEVDVTTDAVTYLSLVCSSDEDDSSNGGAIAAGVIGGLVIVILAIAGACYCRRSQMTKMHGEYKAALN